MNIQNIQELSEQLQSLGLDDLSFELFQKICFKPDHFVLSKKMQEDKDWLTIQLFFKAEPNRVEYVLTYYEAILHKEIELPNDSINGVNIQALDQKMKEIDWAVLFDPGSKKNWVLEDKLNQETGQKIEVIVDELKILDSSRERNFYAAGLKLKYWAGMFDQDLTNLTSPLINKSEFTQRFYFFEGQTGISITEAYRFLQNKWVEKQFLEKEKEESKKKEVKGNGPPSSGNSLLKKKRFSNNSKDKITSENK